MLSTLPYIVQHPLNRSAPIAGLARFARWQIASRLRREVEFRWIEGAKLLVRRGMTGATGNIYCGLHEFTEMAFVLQFLRPGDLFLDVGSNIGSYTVLASKVCGARSVAFEPDPGTNASLRRNIELNAIGGLVETQQVALGAETGEIAFTVGLDTCNHIAGLEDTNVQKVPVRRLDEFGYKPTLIKMDVEGHEFQALSGAEETLASPSLLAILIEGEDPRAVEILTRHGFSRIYYDAMARQYGGDQPVSNALFIRDPAAILERVQSAPRRRVHGVDL